MIYSTESIDMLTAVTGDIYNNIHESNVLTCSTHVLSALELNINMSLMYSRQSMPRALSLAADSCRLTISGAFVLLRVCQM